MNLAKMECAVVRLAIRHQTTFTYDEPTVLCRNLLRLRPRELPFQRVESYELHVDPEPTTWSERLDAFGNPTTQLAIEEAHGSLELLSEATVLTTPRAAMSDEGINLSRVTWEEAVDRIRAGVDEPHRRAVEFSIDSPQVRRAQELAAFARTEFHPGRGLIEAGEALSHRIRDRFVFDPTATQVGTPPLDVLSRGRGVCQDFAHLYLGAVRSLGLSARYVSGYILTHPPPGMPKLVGADASHAWVSLFVPDFGWLDLDPTNAVRADEEHVVVAYGRDYEDVAPVRGIMQGGAGQTMRVAVDVDVVP